MKSKGNGTFYESGSAYLSPSGQELLALLGSELKTLPNNLLIEGHTDAAPYSNDANYGNWELSADRANSARRLMQQDSVRKDQVTQVRGYADQFLRGSSPCDQLESSHFDSDQKCRRLSAGVERRERSRQPCGATPRGSAQKPGPSPTAEAPAFAGGGKPGNARR